MYKFLRILTLVLISFSLQAQVEVSEHLKIFDQFTGKIWKGEFKGNTGERPTYDIAEWEYALNGKAIRILHSVNDGVYGGETIIFWDLEIESLVFYYFTTEGFFTKGDVVFEEGRMITHEKVAGNKDGITEVKSISAILPDGRMHSKSEMLKNGKWTEGHEIYYFEDPNAEVVFKEIIK